MEDRYLNQKENIDRLVKDFMLHRSLIVAFDFDCTVFDFHKVGDTYPRIEELLRYLKSRDDITLILFTAQEGESLVASTKYCIERGYEPDYINESPVMSHTKKPYFNILLDDRAGLSEAVEILSQTLKQIDL